MAAPRRRHSLSASALLYVGLRAASVWTRYRKVNPWRSVSQYPCEPAQTEPIWPPLQKQKFEPAEPPEAALDQPALSGAVAMPRAPESVGEIGLSPSFLLEHVIKVIHYAETPTAEHVARVVGLPTRIIVELLDALKSDRMCEIIGGSTYDLSSTYRFRLTRRAGPERKRRWPTELCRAAPRHHHPIRAGDQQPRR